MWGIGIVTALGAAAAGVAAAQGARGRGRPVWLLTGAAAGSILLGMLARGLPSLDRANAPTFGRDDAGFVAAVVFFVLAATIRLDGERNGLRRARLLLDVVILSLSPAVFGADRDDATRTCSGRARCCWRRAACSTSRRTWRRRTRCSG